MDTQPAQSDTPKISEEILISWEAADRPYKKRSIGYYFNVALIGVIIFLILFFLRNYILIAVLFSLVFVGITLATIPAQPVTYQITSSGIRIGQYLFSWEQLVKFWHDRMLGHDIIVIATTDKIKPRLTLVINSPQKGVITDAIKKYIEQIERPKPNWLDRRAQDLTKLANIGQREQ